MSTTEPDDPLRGASSDAEEKPACPVPDCGSHHIQRRTRSEDGKKWRCDDCGELFDDPDYREMYCDKSPSKGPASLLAREDVTTIEEAREAQ